MKHIFVVIMLALCLNTFAQNWQSLSSGTTNNLNSVYFIDANTGFAVGENGTIIKTIDGGIHWTAQTTGTGSTLTSVYFVNYNIGYAVGSEGIILKTSNGGNTWQVQNSGTTRLLYAVWFVSPTVGYVVGPNGIYLKTIDGVNWESRNFPYGDAPLSKSLYFTDSKTGYAAGAYFIISKTDETGEFTTAPTISACNPPTATHFSSINFANKNVGYATALDYYDQKHIIVKTNDAGLTWECQLNDPDQKVFNSVYFVNPDTGYIACNEGAILKTLNGGADWVLVNSGTFNNLNSVYFLRDVKVGYIVGNAGTILKTGSCAGVLPPTILVNPLSTTKCAHESLALNVSANNAKLYLWKKNGIDIPDADIVNSFSINLLALSDSGKYYCEIKNSCIGIVSDTAFVTVKPLPQVNAGSDVNLCSGGTVILSASGGNLYKWSPAISLSSTDISNPVASPIQTTTYTVTATDLNNCTASDNLKIEVYDLEINAGSDIAATCGAFVQFSNVSTNSVGNETLAYKWIPANGLNNSTIVDPIVKVDVANVYAVEVTTGNGCSASDQLSIELVPMSAPKICILTVTNDNKNQIVWEKSSALGIDSVLIYKETSSTNQYQKIGSVPYEQLSSFVDTQSNPDVQASSYKISLLDSCGFETTQSGLSKTIHLSINKGQGTTWNLIWNDYVGFTVNSYIIYRGNSVSTLAQIGSTTAGNTSYSDLAAPEGNVFYQVEVVSPYSCNQSKESIKSTVSNIASNAESNGINENTLTQFDFTVYPNPVKQVLIIDLKTTCKVNSIEIRNSTGQLIYVNEKKTLKNIENIDVSEFQNGIYLIKVLTDKGIGVRKIVKE